MSVVPIKSLKPIEGALRRQEYVYALKYSSRCKNCINVKQLLNEIDLTIYQIDLWDGSKLIPKLRKEFDAAYGVKVHKSPQLVQVFADDRESVVMNGITAIRKHFGLKQTKKTSEANRSPQNVKTAKQGVMPKEEEKVVLTKDKTSQNERMSDLQLGIIVMSRLRVKKSAYDVLIGTDVDLLSSYHKGQYDLIRELLNIKQ